MECQGPDGMGGEGAGLEPKCDRVGDVDPGSGTTVCVLLISREGGSSDGRRAALEVARC